METIKARLVTLGDLGASDGSPLFDEPLEEAIHNFQARHGLAVDGVIGAATLAALNVTPRQRAEQIAINMERLRWLPEQFGDEYVLVNIAAFELAVMKDGDAALSMRVVVGRTYRQTPIFVSNIEAVEINPFWTVPSSIARKDILPHILADPNYLRRMGFEVFSGLGANMTKLNSSNIDWSKFKGRSVPYTLRQSPGSDNALGRYKFRFANPFGVYLHDTPSKSLFQREQRTFSSGCIRLQDARGLAEYLLRHQSEGSSEFLDAAEASGRNQSFRLKKSVPVVVTYATAWVDREGNLQFRPDVYGRDAALAAFLATREETHAPEFAY